MPTIKLSSFSKISFIEYCQELGIPELELMEILYNSNNTNESIKNNEAKFSEETFWEWVNYTCKDNIYSILKELSSNLEKSNKDDFKIPGITISETYSLVRKFQKQIKGLEIELVVGWGRSVNMRMEKKDSNSFKLYYDFHLTHSLYIMTYYYSKFMSKDKNRFLRDNHYRDKEVFGLSEKKTNCVNYFLGNGEYFFIEENTPRIARENALNTQLFCLKFLIFHEISHFLVSEFELTEPEEEIFCDDLASVFCGLNIKYGQSPYEDYMAAITIIKFLFFLNENYIKSYKSVMYDNSLNRLKINLEIIKQYVEKDWEIEFSIFIWEILSSTFYDTLLLINANDAKNFIGSLNGINYVFYAANGQISFREKTLDQKYDDLRKRN